jgi:hypothetical protein
MAGPQSPLHNLMRWKLINIVYSKQHKHYIQRVRTYEARQNANGEPGRDCWRTDGRSLSVRGPGVFRLCLEKGRLYAEFLSGLDWPLWGRIFAQLAACSAGFLLDLLFYPEDGGDMFLRSHGLSQNYSASQPRRPYSLFIFTALKTSTPTFYTEGCSPAFLLRTRLWNV